MSLTHAVILDFEATTDNAAFPQEIIEFPSVLLDLGTLEVVDAFESFVCPLLHAELSPFCTELTSIRTADVRDAPLFPEVFAAHQAWLAGHGLTEDNALMVTCGNWDLSRMLPAQCRVTEPPIEEVPAIYRQWHNIKNGYARITGRKRRGMARMLDELELGLEGRHHRGIDDCRNLARIVVALIGQGLVLDVTGRRG